MSDTELQIEFIKKLKHFTELVESPEEYFQHMQGHEKELSLILTVFDVSSVVDGIIKALEKQIPKKLKRITTCPSCSSDNSVWEKRANTVSTDIVYCWHCGNAARLGEIE